MPFGTNVVVRRGAGPSPSTGEGGVGVRLSGAERPGFSPHPHLPPPGGKENDASVAIECRTLLREGAGGDEAGAKGMMLTAIRTF